MDDRGHQHQPQQHHNRSVGELPQWNSRFRFSAQKNHAGSNKDQARATPLGQARRVPVAAAAAAGGGGGGAAERQCPKQGASKGAPGGDTTPLEADKTPTLCLFERFERLTLGVTPSTVLNTGVAARTASAAAPTSTTAAAAEAPGLLGSAGSTLTASSKDSEHFPARCRPGRRSVAFGTPSVLTYTPAGAGTAPVQDGPDLDQSVTPLWSNAGHTPYSLAGSSAISAAGTGRIQELGAEDDEEDSGTATDDCPLITAAETGVVHRRAGTGGSSRHGGVRMELFTTVIQEAGVEHTPAAAVALRCPRTPVAAVPESEEGDDCDDGGNSEGDGFYADMEASTRGSSLLPAREHVKAASAVTPAAAHKGAGLTSSSSAAAAAVPADSSPSGSSSSFTGFAGGAPPEQQAGSTTPTLFDCSSSRPPPHSLQHLLAGSASSRSAAAAAGAAAHTSTAVHQHSDDKGAYDAAEPTSDAGYGGMTCTPLSLRPPPTTPKSKLRQPERVAVQGRMPVVPTELNKLLSDADAAAAAASLLGGPDVHHEMLGSCEVLSPVRARRQVQHALGASEQVLTPVRRSARKVLVKGGGPAATPAPSAHATTAAVQPMLEATNYCYHPNDALKQ